MRLRAISAVAAETTGGVGDLGDLRLPVAIVGREYLQVENDDDQKDCEGNRGRARAPWGKLKARRVTAIKLLAAAACQRSGNSGA